MDWKRTLKDRGVLISDGAMGTQLAKFGLEAGACAEGWNLAEPEKVETVARSYASAGADIILTNTFGGNRWKLAKAKLAEKTVEINRAGVELAVKGAADRAVVFASIGPTGEFMAPLGTRRGYEFVEVFAEQIAACAEGGARGVVIETMTAIEEALAALEAARTVGPDLTTVVSMTFDHGPKGYATMMGVTPEYAAREATEAGADIVGANCGNGIARMIDVAKLMRSATKLPLWIKSNAGMPKLVDGETVFDETPEAMASRVRELIAAGANIIGGCCGTGPDHIRAVAEAAAAERDHALAENKAVLDALEADAR